MNETTSRRTILKGAAWAVPVIASSAAVPLAAASVPVTSCKDIPLAERYVLDLRYTQNHGHGGDTGNAWFEVVFDCDPKNWVVMTQSQVMTSGNARLIELAKEARKQKEKKK